MNMVHWGGALKRVRITALVTQTPREHLEAPAENYQMVGPGKDCGGRKDCTRGDRIKREGWGKQHSSFKKGLGFERKSKKEGQGPGTAVKGCFKLFTGGKFRRKARQGPARERERPSHSASVKPKPFSGKKKQSRAKLTDWSNCMPRGGRPKGPCIPLPNWKPGGLARESRLTLGTSLTEPV